MNFPSLRLCAAFTLLLLGVSHVSFAANPEYGTPLDIGALSGGQHTSMAYGINNSGLVCGLSQTSNLSTPPSSTPQRVAFKTSAPCPAAPSARRMR